MSRMREFVGAVAIVAMAVFLVGCKTEITIQCHSDTTDLKVGDEKIGDLYDGEQKDVEIQSLGKTLVKWTNYDGEAQSENIHGEGVEDGEVWHLYHGYGSFDEW